MADTIHIADPDDGEGFSLAHFVSHLGVTPGEPATFLCEETDDLESAWTEWQDTWFVPHLAPAFTEAFLHGREQHTDEVQAADMALDNHLTDSVRDRSVAAATAFLEGKEEMRANPVWKRFSERIAENTTPGHVTVIFALQSALYNLSLAPALTAYAWFEFQSGRPKSGLDEAEADRIFKSVIRHVPVALRGEKGDNSGDAGHLRAI